MEIAQFSSQDGATARLPPARQRDQQLLPHEGLERHRFIVHRHAHEANLNLAAVQRANLLDAGHHLERDRNAGTALAKLAQHGENVAAEGDRGDQADAKLADQALARRLDAGDGGIGLAQDQPRRLEEEGAGLRHGHPPLGPREQLDAELPFQLSNLLAERRLRRGC